MDLVEVAHYVFSIKREQSELLWVPSRLIKNVKTSVGTAHKKETLKFTISLFNTAKF